VTDDALMSVRVAGARMLAVTFWLNVLGLLAAGLFVHSPDTWIVTLFATLLALAPTWLSWRRDVSPLARASLAATAMTYPAFYLLIFKGNVWQMDMHMMFFATLAVLTTLLDRRAIIIAAMVTAAHHFILNYLQPSWVFFSTGDLPRVLFHGEMLLAQTLMLLWIVTRLSTLIASQQRARQISESLRQEADLAKKRAEDALVALEQAQIDADRQRVAEETARHAQEAAERRRMVADELEGRLGLIVGDLTQLSRQLSISKQWLFELLENTVRQSGELKNAHLRAVQDVRVVATDTERLVISINEVGASAGRTRSSAHDGATATFALAPEVEALSATVEAATDIVAAIAEIAAQSRTLSLNAAIEAARTENNAPGFAVVAGEMKALAVQTAHATREIDDHLKGIKVAAGGVSTAMDVATRSVESIDHATAQIAEEVSAQMRATMEIACAAEQMANHIGNAASEADALNAALDHARNAMEQTDAAASALTRRSEELHETVQNVLEELRAA
jgi:methyl-accepting chemotaxis protein